MKVVPTRLWHPFRWLLVLLFIGGGVLAAENNWLSSLRVGQMSLTNWLARLTGDPPVEQAIVPADLPTPPSATYAANSWLNTALFAPAASGWTLDPAKAMTGPMLKTSQTGTVITPVLASSPLPPAFFASGFVSYSPGTDFGPIPSAPSASGNWTLNGSGDWGVASNWAGGVIADGAGNNAHFDLLDITSNVIVNLSTSRTIGNVYLGDTNGTHSYTISGSSTLTFDDNSTDFQVHSVLQQSATSHGDTVAVSMVLNNDLDINNLSATREFTISGNIANASTSGFPILWFNNHDTSANAAGDIRVTGVISDGSATSALNIVVAKGGTVTLTGTNTYSGFTEVDGGTLLINGNNSGAKGTVYVYSGGTLGGTGTIGGNVNLFGGTVTGATATSVGILTMQGNANFATGEGAGGTYLANLSGAMSDLLAITGSIILGADTTLNIVGAADGVTTYVLATFASHNGVFENVFGVPGGYQLVYSATDLELVPIPEPATWLGAALALSAIGYSIQRRRRRRA